MLSHDFIKFWMISCDGLYCVTIFHDFHWFSYVFLQYSMFSYDIIGSYTISMHFIIFYIIHMTSLDFEWFHLISYDFIIVHMISHGRVGFQINYMCFTDVSVYLFVWCQMIPEDCFRCSMILQYFWWCHTMFLIVL